MFGVQRDELLVRVKDLDTTVANLTQSIAVLQRLNLNFNISSDTLNLETRPKAFSNAPLRHIQVDSTDVFRE